MTSGEMTTGESCGCAHPLLVLFNLPIVAQLGPSARLRVGRRAVQRKRGGVKTVVSIHFHIRLPAWI